MFVEKHPLSAPSTQLNRRHQMPNIGNKSGDSKNAEYSDNQQDKSHTLTAATTTNTTTKDRKKSKQSNAEEKNLNALTTNAGACKKIF